MQFLSAMKTNIYFVYDHCSTLMILELKQTIFKDKTNFLPEAHTCFNQLVLPDYKNKVFDSHIDIHVHF